MLNFISVICTGSDDASVRLFSAESGNFLGSNNLHKRKILDLNFVPNSEKVGVKFSNRIWPHKSTYLFCQISRDFR